jgi:hypothetical protein
MTWTLHYENGTTFSSEDGEPQDSLPWGVVFVCQPGVNSRDVLWGHDFLLYRTDLGHWTGHDLIGLVDQLTHFAHKVTAVRPGREMDTDTLKAMIRAAALEMRGR